MYICKYVYIYIYIYIYVTSHGSNLPRVESPGVGASMLGDFAP